MSHFEPQPLVMAFDTVEVVLANKNKINFRKQLWCMIPYEEIHLKFYEEKISHIKFFDPIFRDIKSGPSISFKIKTTVLLFH